MQCHVILKIQKTNLTEHTEHTKMAQTLRNPHQGLKEKLKSLTLLYEQQKLASIGVKNHNFKPQDQNPSTISPLDRNGSIKMEDSDSFKHKYPQIPPIRRNI
jgi:kinesin family member 19